VGGRVFEALRRARDWGLRHLEVPLGEHEAAYREHFLRNDIGQALLGLGLLTAPAVFFAYTDFLLYGWSVSFGLLIALRLSLLTFAIFLGNRLRHTTDHRTYDRLVIAWALAGVSTTLIVNLSRPPTFTYHIAIDALILLAAYLIIPTHLYARLLVGTGLTLSIVVLFLTGRRVADPMAMNVVWASMVLANLMGLTVSCRISTLRRRQFLAMLELQQVRDTLQVMATTDPLTGVYNRRRLMEIASQVLDVALRDRRPLAVIAVDLDHFKQVNDRLGHAAGDDVLAAFARVLREQTRREDVVGRIGGEEFAIVLPRASLQTAREVAERIRLGLHDARVVVDGTVVPVTVSLGVAALRPGDEAPEDLLKRADRALYDAKRRGRDRVEAA
jgi:diguanylate cyclase (GGDEF)-like protein